MDYGEITDWPHNVPRKNDKKILESDILTKVGALYKDSLSKLVLVFGSKILKEKLAG